MHIQMVQDGVGAIGEAHIPEVDVPPEGGGVPLLQALFLLRLKDLLQAACGHQGAAQLAQHPAEAPDGPEEGVDIAEKDGELADGHGKCPRPCI